MGITSGITAIGTYTGPVGDAVDELIALIPDPDTRESPSPREAGSIFDEMSPFAAAQLRVELLALKGVLDAGGDDVAYGTHTVTAAEDTAGLVDIVTGLADTAAAKYSVTVWRAGVIDNGDLVFSEPSAGTLRVADGATDDILEDDVIVWFAIDPSA